MNLGSLSVSDSEPVKGYHGKPARKMENREFVCWDGEGITDPDKVRQDYVLFGNSRDDDYLIGESLTTLECLDYMLSAKRINPLSIHVGFAFGYDSEMILRDVPVRRMRRLRRTGIIRWNGYRVEYRKGKWLQVSKDGTCIRVWDVWSFFGTSFVKALDEYLPDDESVRTVVEGKAHRKTFTRDELNYIVEYWKAEGALFVKLMNTLRERLYGAGLRITQWHGPGAIATFAMKRHGVGALMDRNLSESVKEASQYAYAGGRFELFAVGRANCPVYAYDIRSAYPSAIATLPNLSNGEWCHVTLPSPDNLAPFGVYRVRFSNQELFTTRPMPFFYRDERYAIHYPNSVEGWYWTPEARLVKYCGGEILEGWEYFDDGSKPFAWVEDIYNTRAQWKRDGNPSQIALKLLLNSMYGKFAQRVGWEKFNGPPRWHQLEWAGYITSRTRSILFRAMAEAYTKGALVGVETDGIFSTQPLSVQLGEGLGQWELSTYEDMVYLQSGFYFKKQQGTWSAKYRGFDRDCITLEETLGTLGKWQPWRLEGPERFARLLGTTTRFTTMGTYLRMGSPEDWRNTWVTAPRELRIGMDGKRVHRPSFCQQCNANVSPADAMHGLTIFDPTGGRSIPHNLPWLQKDRNRFREDTLI